MAKNKQKIAASSPPQEMRRDYRSFFEGVLMTMTLAAAGVTGVAFWGNLPFAPPVPVEQPTCPATTSSEWRWSPGGRCRKGSSARKYLTINVSAAEVAAGELAPWTLNQVKTKQKNIKLHD